MTLVLCHCFPHISILKNFLGKIYAPINLPWIPLPLFCHHLHTTSLHCPKPTPGTSAIETQSSSCLATFLTLNSKANEISFHGTCRPPSMLGGNNSHFLCVCKNGKCMVMGGGGGRATSTQMHTSICQLFIHRTQPEETQDPQQLLTRPAEKEPIDVFFFQSIQVHLEGSFLSSSWPRTV